MHAERERQVNIILRKHTVCGFKKASQSARLTLPPSGHYLAVSFLQKISRTKGCVLRNCGGWRVRVVTNSEDRSCRTGCCLFHALEALDRLATCSTLTG